MCLAVVVVFVVLLQCLAALQIPSHFFEFFARTPGVVQQWARHAQSGDKPSMDLLQAAFQHKKDFAAENMNVGVFMYEKACTQLSATIL